MNHVDLATEFGKTQPESQYFLIRYEELTGDDFGMIARLFDWLKIEMHPKVRTFCDSQRGQRTPFSHPARNLAVGAHDSDWGKRLNPKDQLRSLELIGNHLVQYGYATDASLAALKDQIAKVQPPKVTSTTT